MPRSKRVREAPLTQTSKRANKEHKTQLIQQIRDAIDKYDTIYLFHYENMRSSKFKTVRQDLNSDSRLFLGKNAVMQIALGRTEEEEYAENLRHVAKRLKGDHGLLFTNRPHKEMEAYFANLVEPDFARAGAIATGDVFVTREMLNKFPVSMMEQLRKLGMKVEIQKGAIVFVDSSKEQHRLCKEGEVLTAEQCKLLVHFDVKLANFTVTLVGRWSENEWFPLNDDADMK